MTRPPRADPTSRRRPPVARAPPDRPAHAPRPGPRPRHHGERRAGVGASRGDGSRTLRRGGRAAHPRPHDRPRSRPLRSAAGERPAAQPGPRRAPLGRVARPHQTRSVSTVGEHQLPDDDDGPNPEEVLDGVRRQAGAGGRGRLRIYLGMAPGVGKTFAMLNEAHRRKTRGTDVVVGFVETYGRPTTEAAIGDLEIVPRRRIPYQGATLEELDA